MPILALLLALTVQDPPIGARTLILWDGRDDTPLPNARLVWGEHDLGRRIRDIGDLEVEIERAPHGTVRSDALGRVSIPQSSSALLLFASTDTHWGWGLLRRGASPPRMRLYPDPPLSVEVVDPEGAPVPGVPMFVLSRLDDTPRRDEPRIGVGWQPAVTKMRASTDVDGRASLAHAGYAVERSADVDAPGTETHWWLEIGPTGTMYVPLERATPVRPPLRFVLPRSAGARGDPSADFVVRGRFVAGGRTRLPIGGVLLEVYDVAEGLGVDVPPEVVDAPPGTIHVGTYRPLCRKIRTTLAVDGSFELEVPHDVLAPVIVFEMGRYRDRARGARIDLSSALRGEVEVGDVALRPSPLLAAGRVVDTEGLPVPYALVSPHERPRTSRIQRSGGIAGRGPLDERTDRQGNFEIRTFAPLRMFDLYVERPEGTTTTVSDVARGTRELRITLAGPDDADRSR